jgi:demethylmenaquinone methyltransferase/2-methoxy-6-polyprenyl-1,4-benzoquinol methylase
MTSRYFLPGEDRAQGVRVLFDRIAQRYDFINDLQSLGLHRHWKRVLVELAQSQKPKRALDLCCGTGDLAYNLSRIPCRVLALDFSSTMLGVATRRSTQGCPLTPVFIRADALSVPVRDRTFDLVTVGYGLRNLVDIPLGLQEIFRILQPGGWVLILDFGKPSNPAWRAIYFLYLRTLVPFLGWVLAGDRHAYAYILPSLKAYPAQTGIGLALERAGFAVISLKNFLGGVTSIHMAHKPPDSSSEIPIVTPKSQSY